MAGETFSNLSIIFFGSGIRNAKLHLNADAEAASCFRHSNEANRNYPVTHFLLAAGFALQRVYSGMRLAGGTGRVMSGNGHSLPA